MKPCTRSASRGVVPLLLLVAAACGDGGPESPVGVEEPPVAAPPHRAEIVVEAPSPGATVSAVIELRARVVDRDPSTYRMTWRVDGGEAAPLSDAGDGTVTSRVDVSAWTWNGAGPYTLTLRAEDAKGRRVAETRVEVLVATTEPDDTTSTDTTPTDTTSTGTTDGNPLADVAFWVDPHSNAAKQADAWRESRPTDAAYMDHLAGGAQADWFGEWSLDVSAAVDARVSVALADGGVPVLVAYNIPGRDCDSYSGGGAGSAAEYRAWIDDFALGLGGRMAVVILEPDALALMGCLPASMAEERFELLAYAVRTLTERTGAVVYLDAGHARWHDPATMADRLVRAGVAEARGFSLNVSNFVGDAESVEYGRRVSDLLGGASFVVDASRNGRGPDPDGEWCNPGDRGLGRLPTADTGEERVDAFLWVKRPGESDGECNGGPSAGTWWADYALGLAQRAADGVGAVAEEE